MHQSQTTIAVLRFIVSSGNISLSGNISCEHYNIIISQRNAKNFNSLSIWNGMLPISLRYYLFLEGLMLDLCHIETVQNSWVMDFWCHRVQKYVDFSLGLSGRLLFIW